MNLLLLGALAMACLTASLLFLRFWKTTHDRFFLFFAVSFGMEGVNRSIQGFTNLADEQAPIIYLFRFLAFLVIVLAIIDKNRAGKMP